MGGLRLLANRGGLPKGCLRDVYIQCIESCLAYGAPAYFPRLPKAKKDEIRKFQYAAAKTILGFYTIPNADATLIKAGIEPFPDCCDAEAASLVGKARSRPLGDPLRDAV